MRALPDKTDNKLAKAQFDSGGCLK